MKELLQLSFLALMVMETWVVLSLVAQTEMSYCCWDEFRCGILLCTCAIRVPSFGKLIPQSWSLGLSQTLLLRRSKDMGAR